jgi:hypothetical protein
MFLIISNYTAEHLLAASNFFNQEIVDFIKEMLKFEKFQNIINHHPMINHHRLSFSHLSLESKNPPEKYSDLIGQFFLTSLHMIQ